MPRKKVFRVVFMVVFMVVFILLVNLWLLRHANKTKNISKMAETMSKAQEKPISREKERLPEIIRIKIETCLRVLKGHKYDVESVAFSPDGKLLASGSRDWTIRIWGGRREDAYAKTILRVKTEDGEVISVPKGAFLTLSRDGLSYPIKGTILSGKTEPLFRSRDSILIFKPAHLKPYPEAQFNVRTIPEGSILKNQEFLLTEDKRYAYIKWHGFRGFITTDVIAKIKPVKKYLAFSDAKEKLRISPKGEFISDIPLGETLKTVYYCPYFDSYFVETKSAKGWILASATKELSFEKIGRTGIALKDTPVRLGYFVDNAIGYIAEGSEVKVISKVKGVPYYYIRAGNTKGYIPCSNIVFFKKAKQKRIWVTSSAKLLQAPSDKATPIGEVEEFSELRPLKIAGDFYYVKVLSTGQKGWLNQAIITDIKPDLCKPFIKIVKKQKIGNKLIISGIVADDTKIKGVYANGEPVLNLKKTALTPKLPFKPEDVRKFTYKVFIPEGYPEYELVLQVADREQKTSSAQIKISGYKVMVKEEKPVAKKVLHASLKGIPKLVLSVSISDENRNNVFEGREKVRVFVKAKNVGKGTAQAVKLVIKGAKALGIPELLTIGTLYPGRSVEKTYIYRLSDRIEGKHRISFVLKSADGFMSKQRTFVVVAKNYEPPNIIFDYALRDANGNMKLEPGEEGTLYVVLSNTGGNAKRVYVSVGFPSYVRVIQGKTEHIIPQIPHGETKKIGINIVVPQAYAMKNKDIPISVKVKTGEFSKNKAFMLALGQYIQPPEEVVLKPKVKRAEMSYIACSDVDREVKGIKQGKKRSDALALVIGIGSYKSLPVSIYSEYDALLMQGLFKKVYGMPVKSLINEDATFVEIKNAVQMLSADAKGKDVYVYYSGHGFPKKHSPAIVPYDSPESLRSEYLISLSWIAEEFKKAGAKKVVILADACYSGYSREGQSILSKARPAILELKRFIVGDVFSAATSKDGKSYSDKKLRHGIFTYYLAKGLLEGDKNKDGAVEVSELKSYLDEAKRHARRLGYSDQKPVIWAAKGTMVVVKR